APHGSTGVYDSQTGFVNLKRSHSVKAGSSAMGMRKSSWGGGLRKTFEGDKENDHTVVGLQEEVFREESGDGESAGEDGESASDAGTCRRTSYGTSVYSAMESHMGGSEMTEGTEEGDGNEFEEEEEEVDEGDEGAEDNQMVLFGST